MRTVNRHAIFFVVFFSFTVSVFGQTKEVDSLKNELSIHVKEDSVRVDILNELANNYYANDLNTSQSYLDEALSIINTIDYKNGEARNLYIRGIVQIMKGDFESTIDYYQKALELYQISDNKMGVSDCYAALATISRYKSDYQKSIEYQYKAVDIKEDIGNLDDLADALIFLGTLESIVGNYSKALIPTKRALRLFEELNQLDGISRSQENLGEIYQRLGNYPLALEHYNKSLNIRGEEGETSELADTLKNVGLIYERQENFDLALEYYYRALAIYTKNGNKRGVTRSNIYIGGLLRKEKDYEKALQFLNSALSISQEINDQENMASSLNYIGHIYRELGKLSLAYESYKKAEQINLKTGNRPVLSSSYLGIGNTLFNQKKYSQALYYALKSKEIGYETNSLINQSEAQYLLFNIYRNTQDFDKALISLEEYKRISDSLFNKESIEKIARLENEYKYQKALDSANIKELQLKKTITATNKDLEKTQRNLLLGIIIFLGTALILGIIIFSLKLRNAQTTTQKVVIEQKLLRSQMTPHFIFNSLSVLQGMILNKEEKKSVSYLSKFSKLLRIILENSRDKTVSLAQELKAIQNYLALQNLENDAYEHTILVEETIDVPSFEIPPMLIQPFVENAIEHAFVNKTEHMKIDIRLTYENKKLTCTITDNGIGYESQNGSKNRHKKSLSTAITSERLKILSKDLKMEGTVTIEDRKQFNEKGTIVTLVIPHKIIA